MIRSVQRCGNFFRKNKKVLAHVAIVLALFSIATWDAALIINDYMNNNRYTLVKPLVANDRFPFLKNVSIRLEVDFSPRSILRAQTNSDIDTVELNFTLYKDFVNRILINQTDIGDMSLNSRRMVVKLLSRIRDIDLSSFECTAYGTNKSCSYVSNKPLLDSILKHTFYIERLEENLWKGVQENIIHEYENFLNIKSDVRLLCLDNFSGWIEINLPAILKPANKWFAYLVGVIVDQNESLILNDTIKHLIRVFNNENVISWRLIEGPEATEIALRVSNIGIYDKKQTTKCVSEPVVYHPDFSSLPSCTLRQYLEIVFKECSCVPFTYRRQFKTINKNFGNQQISYCTIQLYNWCFIKVQKTFSRKPDCIASCITIRNQYSVSSTVLRRSIMCSQGFEAKKCSWVALSLECEDFSYTIYEERFQLTSSQLLSQVGGDFGLYTGISILGVWQFLLYIYGLYRSHQKSETLNNAEARPSKCFAASTFFALLNHYFETNKNQSTHNSRDEKATQSCVELSETIVTGSESEILSKKDLADMEVKIQMQLQQVETQIQVQMQMQLQMEAREQRQQELIQQILAELKRQSVTIAKNPREDVVVEQAKTIYRM